jgi:hypothetical protein
VAEENEDKPEGETPAEETTERSQETAVGHSVVEEPSAAEPARETATGHPVVEPEDSGAATEVFFSRDEKAPPQPAAAPPASTTGTGTGGGTSPAAADREAADAAQDPFVQKPELFVAGAFVGAFLLGKILKKLTGSDD